MSVTGIISNGVVVLPEGISFPEGSIVEVIAPKPLPTQGSVPVVVPEPRDEWERRLLAIATDCGVSLSNEALGREEMYD
jgi:hypothetical protein